MKIVILDGYAENPGDLSWDWLLEYGEYTVYDRTPSDKILERAAGHDIVITNKTPLKREILEKLPEIKYIGLLSTGYNVVDWEYCRDKTYPFAISRLIAQRPLRSAYLHIFWSIPMLLPHTQIQYITVNGHQMRISAIKWHLYGN